MVVGGGSAAFEARVAAKQSGAVKSSFWKKAPEPEFGGNALSRTPDFASPIRRSGNSRLLMPNMSGFEFDACTLIPAHTPADFTADLMRVTRGRINQTR